MESNEISAVTITLSERELIIIRAAIEINDNDEGSVHLHQISNADAFMNNYFGNEDEYTMDDPPVLYEHLMEYQEEYGIDGNPITLDEIMILQKKITTVRRKYPGELIFNFPQFQHY